MNQNRIIEYYYIWLGIVELNNIKPNFYNLEVWHYVNRHILCVHVFFHTKYDWNNALTNQMVLLADLQDCSEYKLYPFIQAYQFGKFKFLILINLFLLAEQMP